MDLVLRVGILIIVLIAIFSVGYYLTVRPSQSTVLTQQAAEQKVLSDISNESPTAAVNVLSVGPSKNYNDSWDVSLKVVYNGTRPCPTVTIIDFDYPALGLVPTSDNVWTTKCQIVNMSLSAGTLPEIAQVQAYTSSSWMRSYVYDYGMNNVIASAKQYPQLNASATPLNMSFSNVWLVNYSAVPASYNEYVILNQQGSVQANYTLQK